MIWLIEFVFFKALNTISVKHVKISPIHSNFCVKSSLPHVKKWSITADLQTFKGCYSTKTTDMGQILHSLSYKRCSIILPKFIRFGLFILILGTPAIMDHTACCYVSTTS